MDPRDFFSDREFISFTTHQFNNGVDTLMPDEGTYEAIDTKKVRLKNLTFVNDGLDNSFSSFRPVGNENSFEFRLEFDSKKLVTGIGAKIRLRDWSLVSLVFLGYTKNDIVTGIKLRKIQIGGWLYINFDFKDLGFGLLNDWTQKVEESINDLRIYIQGEPKPEIAYLDIEGIFLWYQDKEAPDWLIRLPIVAVDIHIQNQLIKFTKDFYVYSQPYKEYRDKGFCPTIYGKKSVLWSPFDRKPAELDSSVSHRFAWQAWHPVIVMMLSYFEDKDLSAVFAARDFANSWIEDSYLKVDPDQKYAWYDHGVAERLLGMLLLWTAGVALKFDFRFMSKLRFYIFRHAQLLASETFYSYSQAVRYHNHAWFQDYALIACALIMKDLPCSNSWFQIGVDRLSDQFKNLIVQDGEYAVFVENATGYHLGLEKLFKLIIELVEDRSEFENIKSLKAGMEKYSNMLRYLDSRVPTIGDTHRTYIKNFDIKNAKQKQSFDSVILEKAGYAFIHGQHMDSLYMLSAVASSISITHKHEDHLSCSFYFDGIEWLIDPSFYSYDFANPVTAYLRSARAHNALSLPGLTYELVPNTAKVNGQVAQDHFKVEMTHSAYQGLEVDRSISGSLSAVDMHFIDQVRILNPEGVVVPPMGILTFQSGEEVAVDRTENGFILKHPKSTFGILITYGNAETKIFYGKSEGPEPRGIAAHGLMEMVDINTVEVSVDLSKTFEWKLRAINL
jgi:hypothetical protein